LSPFPPSPSSPPSVHRFQNSHPPRPLPPTNNHHSRRPTQASPSNFPSVHLLLLHSSLLLHSHRPLHLHLPVQIANQDANGLLVQRRKLGQGGGREDGCGGWEEGEFPKTFLLLSLFSSDFGSEEGEERKRRVLFPFRRTHTSLFLSLCSSQIESSEPSTLTSTEILSELGPGPFPTSSTHPTPSNSRQSSLNTTTTTTAASHSTSNPSSPLFENAPTASAPLDAPTREAFAKPKGPGGRRAGAGRVAAAKEAFEAQRSGSGST